MLRLRPEHLSDLHTHPGAGGVDDAQRTSPQGRWSFLLHLLHGQCLNKHLCSREVTGAQEVGNSTDSEGQWFCSSSSPRRALLSCGLSLMPRVLASWSGPAAPRCCSCTGTTRVQRIHTPDGPPETRAVHAILTLVATFVTLLNSIVAFYVTVSLPF